MIGDYIATYILLAPCAAVVIGMIGMMIYDVFKERRLR